MANCKIVCSALVALLACGSTAEARFLQTDPAGYQVDPDLYTYVADDPTDRTDPHGSPHDYE